MSDHIPFHIQVNIIKMLPVKSLIRSRSVSKAWKALIDSSEFVAHTLTRRSNQQHHLMVRYIDVLDREIKYVLVADDDNDDTLLPQQHEIEPLNQIEGSTVAGTSDGLLCFYGTVDSGLYKAVIWNPSIRKAVDVPMPNMLQNYQYDTFVRFGVRQDTLDPMIVTMTFNHDWNDCNGIDTVPWKVEVFTLSSRTWRRTLCSSSDVLRGDGVRFERSQVVIGGFIYWLGLDEVDNTVFSFDMVTEECTRVILPECLKYPRIYGNKLSISKLRDSLAIFDYDETDFEVWVMEPVVASSFTKLYSITAPNDGNINTVLGLRNNGAPILEIEDDNEISNQGSVAVSDRDLKHFNSIGVRGLSFTFEAHFYMETLLLL
ncbi:F-box protein CPR1-like [Rutidosis leptorrhynchoides]|uniref:F-box protein CPR1-like n=1 Tax=Rutidosis leptorrhynchoides TaxID=125765 RepID=UPI003A9954A4